MTSTMRIRRRRAAVRKATPIERRLSGALLLHSTVCDRRMWAPLTPHLAATLPDATHHHLEWAGHLPALERPDLVAPLLLDFLRA